MKAILRMFKGVQRDWEGGGRPTNRGHFPGWGDGYMVMGVSGAEGKKKDLN